MQGHKKKGNNKRQVFVEKFIYKNHNNCKC